MLEENADIVKPVRRTPAGVAVCAMVFIRAPFAARRRCSQQVVFHVPIQ